MCRRRRTLETGTDDSHHFRAARRRHDSLKDTQAGEQVSPKLEWANLPEGTESFVINVLDPRWRFSEAPRRPFVAG
ncbi:MAG TPA: YbhB/YbcL family Raf kinase inhibitor-like protein [Gemmatimonadaceae bacterium]|nr:YbhB/YbcL family Raf kinase inhibitor-like protein [Gemmatimonadaceae bacterium]